MRGYTVFAGDVLVGDQDGVMVVPVHPATEIAEECGQMEVYDSQVMEQLSKGEPIASLYPLTGAKQK